jgi:hypothetical protein
MDFNAANAAGFRRGKSLVIEDHLKSLSEVGLVGQETRVLVAFPAFSG